MNGNYFSLEVGKSNRLTRIFQLVLGILCIGIALGWLITNFSSFDANRSLWLTIIFLLGFGYFQINSGLGKGDKFIEIGEDKIRLKRNSVLPVRELHVTEIAKTEIYPLSVVFFMKSGKKDKLRFGTTYPDIINPVRQSIEDFCARNNIESEIRKEEL